VFRFDPAGRAAAQLAARIDRAQQQSGGSYACGTHGPLPTACGRKCPLCGPSGFVRWNPTATPTAELLRPPPLTAPKLPAGLATTPTPEQMARSLARLNEDERLAHARALGCRDGPGNTPTLEAARGASGDPQAEAPAEPPRDVGLAAIREAAARRETAHLAAQALALGRPAWAAPRTLEERLRAAGLEAIPESDPVPAAGPVGGRSRDPSTGRYLPEPCPHAPDPDERMSQEEVYASMRKVWHQLPHGSRKGFARLLRLPVATVRGIAKGRARLKVRILRTAIHGRDSIVPGGLPEAARCRCSRILNQIERGELEPEKTEQHWRNGCPRFHWRRRPPDRRHWLASLRAEVGDAGV
jgi:hypothetical protein